MRYENSMRKVADDILKEEREEQKWRSDPSRFYDEFATMEFFRHVCFRFGNLKSGEIDKLVTRLKLEDVKAVEKHEHNRMRIIYRCCMDD